MPRPSHLFAPPVVGLAVPVHIDPSGVRGPTKPQSRGPRWRRTSPGRFVPSDISNECVEQRIVEAAHRGGPRAVVTGWAALRLHGAAYFDGLGQGGTARLPVPIAANGERFGDCEDALVLRLNVPCDEVTTIHGVRCTTVERAVFDEMRRRRTVRAMVVVADMALAAELTSLTRLRRYRAERRWYRDVRTFEAALDLCDENSWSPYESEFRLVWECDAGWGHPLCNHPVLDLDGRLIGIPDLIDPSRGVIGEYAGAHHRDRDRHESDVLREAALRAAGLECVEAVRGDIHDFPRLVRRLREAERRAAASTLPRRWQLGVPDVPDLNELLAARDRRVTRTGS